MKINRVRLRNFCGVTEVEVGFAPKGVTIVHGPNEAGKSTLMHGINVLFNHRDDSRKEEVRLTKPVNRDVGSEVEADVEIGEFVFTYFKRFHKDKETRLTIREPRSENLVGREAHERVQQIMSASVDMSLWQALRIIQGRNLDMPELHNQPALAQALDRVAGKAKAGETEEALIDAAHSEYRKYFTDTGKEKEDPIGQSRARALEVEETESELLRQLKEVEADIARFESVEKSVANLKRGLSGLEAAKQKAQIVWEAISKLSDNVERAKAAYQIAEQSQQSAKSSVQQRLELVSQVKAVVQKVEDSKIKSCKTSDALLVASESLRAITVTRETASAMSIRHEAEERIRRADHEFIDEQFELVRMEERLGHVVKADSAAAQASAIVVSTKITEKLRAGIRSAEIGLSTARGILSAGSPRFAVKALKSIALRINGTPQAIEAGQIREVLVSEVVTATIDDLAELKIEPGSTSESLSQAVSDAEEALSKACTKAGVASPEEAESAWAALQDATRTVADRDRIAKEHLRDLTREELRKRIEVSRAKAQAYATKRTSSLLLPETLEQAKEFLEAASREAAEAKKTLSEADAVFVQVQENHAKCREEHAANSALLQQSVNDQALASERLEEQRIKSSDEDLAIALATAEVSAKSSLEALKFAERGLEGVDPESARAILESSSAALVKARNQCEEQDRELLTLRTRLDLLGEKGLAEALAETQRIAFERRDSLGRLLRRSAAARLLYETLRAEQKLMRKAYVAPLRESIEKLGRHVFGPTLRVEVNENLQVVGRTVDGITVSLEQLSTGAREQMGLLVRLAAASIVSGDGGVPLILDDALGSTDEGRLESMGAILRIASLDIQTIILTCAPERYIHVGAEATVSI